MEVRYSDGHLKVKESHGMDLHGTPATTENATATPASTVSHRSFSAASAVSFTGASTGTIEAASPLSGAAAHGWRPPDTPATAGR